MIDYLNNIDTALFSFFNGMHCGYFDRVMWLMSGRLTWLLMIIVLIYVLFRRNWKTGVAVIIGIALVILFCDQISSTFIKPVVHRLRPSHTESLSATIHLINGYTSGLYGFVSSHATNSFGVAMLVSLIFKNKWLTTAIFTWAVIVCYSRIYVGVHYPGDIICGAALGSIIGWVVYQGLFKLVIAKSKKYQISEFNQEDSRKISLAISFNLIGVFIAAIFYVL